MTCCNDGKNFSFKVVCQITGAYHFVDKACQYPFTQRIVSAKQRSDYSGIGYHVDAFVKAIVCNLCDGIADKLDRKFTAAIRTGERFIFWEKCAFQCFVASLDRFYQFVVFKDVVALAFFRKCGYKLCRGHTFTSRITRFLLFLW